MSNLYEVEISFRLVVEVEDNSTLENTVKGIVRSNEPWHLDNDVNYQIIQKITLESKLPDKWDSSCYPYSLRSNDDMLSIKEILDK